MLIAALAVAASFVGPPQPADCRTPKPRIAPAAIVYFSGQALDLGLTEYGLAHGGQEINPLQRHRAVRVTVSLGAAAALTYFDVRAQRRGSSTKKYRIAYGALKVATIAWNVRQSAKQR